jgi:hypothetical protein
LRHISLVTVFRAHHQRFQNYQPKQIDMTTDVISMDSEIFRSGGAATSACAV